MSAAPPDLAARGPERARRERRQRIFVTVAAAATFLPLAALAVLLADVFVDGVGRLGWDFLTGFPSRRWERAGILPALAGSAGLMVLTAAFALPVGVAAAVYLEEYAEDTRLNRLIELNIANLAGVPSVIYGLLGLGIFVRALGLGRSLVAGAATLALLVLPIVILSSREALRGVPDSIREAALALGCTRHVTTWRIVVPQALPGILTGAILALSRAIGETAPLVVVGALTYITFLPDGLDAPFTALPIQIFNWVSRPQAGFATDAAAAIIVLLGTLLIFNAGAILLRDRMERRRQP